MKRYVQMVGEHNNVSLSNVTVINNATIQMAFTLLCMPSNWVLMALVIDKAFLCIKFKGGKLIYMGVTEEFEKFYEKNDIFLLQKTIYRLYWVVKTNGHKPFQLHKSNGNLSCNADPCMHFKWNNKQLVLWTSGDDDYLILWSKEALENEKCLMMTKFDGT